MKALIVVQQSIYNNEGLWLSADSNPMMMMGLIDQLAEKTKWDIDVMMAPVEKIGDVDKYEDLLIRPSDRVNFIAREGPVSAFTNRYHFDVDYFKEILGKGKYDVIINNIIELTRNMKTVLWDLKLNTKLAVGNYWIDAPAVNEEKVPREISYDWRQVDGAECADLVAFTCNSTAQVFNDNCVMRFGRDFASEIFRKSRVWDFGFSQTELNKYRNNGTGKTEKKLIVFPNRLSGINYTHHEEFITAVNELYSERRDFGVIFTNPSGKFSIEDLSRMCDPILLHAANYENRPLTRREYINLLWKADIAVSLYTIERYGGCANVEAIFCECFPVMTDFGEYPSRCDGGHPLVKTDLSNLKEVLGIALDVCRIESPLCYDIRKNLVAQKSSYERVSEQVIHDIEEICQKH